MLNGSTPCAHVPPPVAAPQKPRWLICWCHLASVAGILLLGAATIAAGGAESGLAEDPLQRTAEQQRVAELIAALGSQEPVVREKAEEDLAAEGMLAFEALQDAADHEDIEIRLRAQRVLERLRKNAMHADVDPALELFLGELWSKDVEKRYELLELALQAEPVAALTPACQAVRFEKSELNAKRTALLILNQPLPVDSTALTERHRMILEATGPSRRDPCQWLRSYAHSLLEPQQRLEEFAKLVEEERRQGQFDRRQNEARLPEWLTLCYLDMLRRAGSQEAFAEGVLAMAREHRSERQLLWEMTGWLLERDQSALVQQLSSQLTDPFEKDRLLMYRVAQAARKSGNDELAEQWANKAFELELIPPDDESGANLLLLELQNKENEGISGPVWVGYQLGDTIMELGEWEWGKREFRRAIDVSGDWTQYRFFAYTALAESLHDHGKHAEAAEVLEPVGRGVEEGKPEVVRVFEELIQKPGESAARWRYFRARAKLQEGDLAAAREELRIGIGNSSSDSDILIAMYRMPEADEAWKAFTQQQLQHSIAGYRASIRAAQARMSERNQQPFQQVIAMYELTQTLNQFAWLVGNTEGDVDEAIRMSRESMTIDAPNGSQLDTLARCYYRAGDLTTALRCQRQAARLHPHSQQIGKQLKLFEAEVEASR